MFLYRETNYAPSIFLFAKSFSALIVITLRKRWSAIAESASIRRDKPYITVDSIVRMIVFSVGIVVALGQVLYLK